MTREETGREEGWVLMPIHPTLAMMDAAWGICGTKLSEMEPNSEKIKHAMEQYQKLLRLRPPEPTTLPTGTTG